MTNPNRAEVIDQNFVKWVRNGTLPEAHSLMTPDEAGLSGAAFMDLFETQIMSRHLDLAARRLRARNQTFYTIGSSGHEGNAAVAAAFRVTDMAFLHYRSGAFFIQRAKQLPGSTPLYDGLLSLAASSDDAISQGRHKVFGSVPLNIPPQTSTIASHLPKAVGAALSISRARDLKIQSRLATDSVVLCTFGDASANHATALAAFNTTSLVSYQKLPVPLVFVCEDNGIGISVPTPQGWIAANFSNRPGLKYFTCDGLNLADTYAIAQEAEEYTRTTRRPAFLHIRTIRLLGHAGSDVELSYRGLESVEATERQDPLLHSARIAISEGYMSGEEIVRLYEGMRKRIEWVGEEAVTKPRLNTAEAVMAAVIPPKGIRPPQKPISEDERAQKLGDRLRQMQQKQHFARLHNWGIADVMLQYPHAVLFGEDVAKKGGVYNVTTGLLDLFGSKRVFNSPLDETSILGNAIGLAHNGFLPIPEIQFLAYVHNAEDQIRGEAATLSFFSSGQYQNPMIIRIAGLAYQKGFGGHFHNDNSLTVFRDLPGVVVAVPSNGADAVKMFRHCARLAHEDGRIVVFVEPIALYMTKDLHSDGDGQWMFEYPKVSEEIQLDEIGISGQSDELVIVTYGNGYYLSLQAQKILETQHGIQSKVLDVRWINPLPMAAIKKAIANAKKVLVVEECRQTGSVSEQIVAGIVQGAKSHPTISVHAAKDCFIPLGVAATITLPSRDSIVQESLALVGAKVQNRSTMQRKKA